jgi:hypothetical protein
MQGIIFWTISWSVNVFCLCAVTIHIVSNFCYTPSIENFKFKSSQISRANVNNMSHTSSLPSTPESARAARKNIFNSMTKNNLENWLSTNSKEITEDKCADVFENLLKINRNRDTSKVWRLLHDARCYKDEAQMMQNINDVVQLLGNCTVEGIDQDMQDKLCNAKHGTAQDVIAMVYEHLTHNFLYSDRCLLDVEIQTVIEQKSQREQITLKQV